MSYLRRFTAALPKTLRPAEIISQAPKGLWTRDPVWAAATALSRWGKFDVEDYCRRYPDVKNNGMDPILHFCKYGIDENRMFKVVGLAKRKSLPRRPRVSVLAPVYNNAQYLPECFDSILGQTLEDIELIIINDGSTDPQAVRIMAEYAENDERVRLINKKNSGYGHSLNVGLEAARGKYIGIVESDDYVLPGTFARYYEVAEKHDLEMVKSDFRRFFGAREGRIFEDVPILGEHFWYNQVIDPWVDEELREYVPTFVVIWNGIYRREFLLQHKICFHETPGASFQDNGFWFQTFMQSRRLMYLPESYYMLRRDNIGSSVFGRAKGDVMRDEYRFIYERMFAGQAAAQARFIKMFQSVRYDSYMFNLWRVRRELRPALLEDYRQDFAAGWAKGEFDPGYMGSRLETARQVCEGRFDPDCWGKVNLSVILPDGLGVKELRNAIKSLQKQTYKDIEIICIETGRDAAAYAMLRAEAQKDSRLKVFYESDGEKALEHAANYAVGEYVLAWKPGMRVNADFLEQTLKEGDHKAATSGVAGGNAGQQPAASLAAKKDMVMLQGAVNAA